MRGRMLACVRLCMLWGDDPCAVTQRMADGNQLKPVRCSVGAWAVPSSFRASMHMPRISVVRACIRTQHHGMLATECTCQLPATSSLCRRRRSAFLSMWPLLLLCPAHPTPRAPVRPPPPHPPQVSSSPLRPASRPACGWALASRCGRMQATHAEQLHRLLPPLHRLLPPLLRTKQGHGPSGSVHVYANQPRPCGPGTPAWLVCRYGAMRHGFSQSSVLVSLLPCVAPCPTGMPLPPSMHVPPARLHLPAWTCLPMLCVAGVQSLNQEEDNLFTQSLNHAITHSITQSLTQSLNHPITQPGGGQPLH